MCCISRRRMLPGIGVTITPERITGVRGLFKKALLEDVGCREAQQQAGTKADNVQTRRRSKSGSIEGASNRTLQNSGESSKLLY
jgi:hypothetical protein